MKSKIMLAACSLLLLAAGGCALMSGWNKDVKPNQRLEAFPTQGLGLKGRTEIYFNQYQIPFVHAEYDEDLPVALGMVHAHLRLAQMEVFRRVSQGRLSEMFGPFVSDVDYSLRILDLKKAVPRIAASLPPDTRAWLEGFVRGVNLYVQKAGQLSPELDILGIKPEPWSLEDILTIGRLAAVDVNWLFWYNSLGMRDQKAWPEVWRRMKKESIATPPSFSPGSGLPAELMSGSVKSGSNCFAISAKHSKSGGAILANDAHVGLSLPALWLMVGYKSPSHHVLGFSFPGVPLVVMGRNAHIAWGGTNMLSLSSSLYKLPADMNGRIKERTENIKVRWWLDDEVKIRDTDLGPVITDSPMFKAKDGMELILKWRGHMPSDEATAFFRVNQAQNWQEFQKAFESYAISGQNLLYADDKGNIGQVMAVEFDPAAGRTGLRLVGDPADPKQLWKGGFKSTELPSALNPKEGFLISTNNSPVKLNPPLSLFAQASDRYLRAKDFLTRKGKVSSRDLQDLQTDVYSGSSHRLAQTIARLAEPKDEAETRLHKAIASWDGRYAVDSAGAAALELTAFYLAGAVYQPKYGDKLAKYLSKSPSVYTFINDDLKAGGHQAALAGALEKAAKDFCDYPTWGKMHYLRLGHLLGNVPVVGSKFRFGEFPYPGSSRTLLKSAHSLSNEKHYARYGANARFIADMSGLDENYFALLGGQDGFLGSKNFLDLFGLWSKGEYVKIPMQVSKVKEQFGHKLELK
jgi:penicillin amidase